MSTEILIPIDEPARLLSAIAEEMDYSELEAAYSRRGRIGYSPKNLFKIIIYGVSQKVGRQGLKVLFIGHLLC